MRKTPIVILSIFLVSAILCVGAMLGENMVKIVVVRRTGERDTLKTSFQIVHQTDEIDENCSYIKATTDTTKILIVKP